ncbi:hypothetical protein ACO0LG_23730 [Undibacterium sp. Ji42W]|uniref:hypothetical protein n=1 Tax=Undibacterium sp. Ji42W TaxID=3413039 RepID=UPI003BF434B9
MRLFNYATITLAALVLCACNTLPTYTPGADTKMVPIRVMSGGTYSLCQKGKRFSLPLKMEANDVGHIYVPAGDVIGLSVYSSQPGYNKITYCTVGLNFKPMENHAYVMNSGLYESKCFTELVRQDSSKDTGVSVDSSVTYYSCTP